MVFNSPCLTDNKELASPEQTATSWLVLSKRLQIIKQGQEEWIQDRVVAVQIMSSAQDVLDAQKYTLLSILILQQIIFHFTMVQNDKFNPQSAQEKDLSLKLELKQVKFKFRGGLLGTMYS
ncbi:hypothetical protein Tco_0121256 [Tanacetum coccineum]